MLVENYKQAWKWFSTWMFVIIAYIAAGPLPEQIVASLPEQYRGYVVSGLAVLGLILRLIKQSKPVDYSPPT